MNQTEVRNIIDIEVEISNLIKYDFINQVIGFWQLVEGFFKHQINFVNMMSFNSFKDRYSYDENIVNWIESSDYISSSLKEKINYLDVTMREFSNTINKYKCISEIKDANELYKLRILSFQVANVCGPCVYSRQEQFINSIFFKYL